MPSAGSCPAEHVCVELDYLHVHDVVVNPLLVLLQHLQECPHRLSGSEELQVGLGSRRPSPPVPAGRLLGAQQSPSDAPREDPRAQVCGTLKTGALVVATRMDHGAGGETSQLASLRDLC